MVQQMQWCVLVLAYMLGFVLVHCAYVLAQKEKALSSGHYHAKMLWDKRGVPDQPHTAFQVV